MINRNILLVMLLFSIATTACQHKVVEKAVTTAPDDTQIARGYKALNEPKSGVIQVVIPKNLSQSDLKRLNLSGSAVYASTINDVIDSDRTILVGHPVYDFVSGRTHYVR